MDRKKIFLFGIIMPVLILAGVVGLLYSYKIVMTVKDFNSCVKAGFTASKTNPRTCSTPFGGKFGEEVRVQEESCVRTETGERMGLAEAKDIAYVSECTRQGSLLENHICNENSGTWWIDLDIKREGCSPACVIDVASKSAEINWRCTGLNPTSK
jgi:hypothetical protein